MKIVVLGGTGLIGRKLIPLLERRGYEAIPASPATGVNTLTGEGLDATLAGTNVVVDVTNSPSFEEEAVFNFFTTSTRNTLAAEERANVAHHVALSVVGVDRLVESPYMRAKMAQEELIRASRIPFTILRATQFFEFLAAIAGPGTREVHVSNAPMQPLAADDVAAALADSASSPPAYGILEVTGPAPGSIAEFVAKALAATGDPRRVIADPKTPYFGAVLDEQGLLPSGGDARRGSLTHEQWLEQHAARK